MTVEGIFWWSHRFDSHFHCRDKASDPGWGTELLQAMGGEGQKNKREREKKMEPVRR